MKAPASKPVEGTTFEPYVAYLESLTSRWSSEQSAKLLTPQVIEYLQPRFYRCSSSIKIRILLSFLQLTELIRKSHKHYLMEILLEAEIDADEWVRKLSKLVESFVAFGSIDIRETDTEAAFKVMKFLDTQRINNNLKFVPKPPLEAPYLANPLIERCMANHPDVRALREGKIPETIGDGPGEVETAAASLIVDMDQSDDDIVKWLHLMPGGVVFDSENFTPSAELRQLGFSMLEEGAQEMRDALLEYGSSDQ